MKTCLTFSIISLQILLAACSSSGVNQEACEKADGCSLASSLLSISSIADSSISSSSRSLSSTSVFSSSVASSAQSNVSSLSSHSMSSASSLPQELIYNTAEIESLQAELQLTLDNIDCDFKTNGCDSTAQQFMPALPSVDASAVILVMDWGLSPLLASPYAERIAGYFSLDGNLLLVDEPQEIEIPNYMADILAVRRSYPGHISSQQFSGIIGANNATALYGSISNTLPGHGYFIASFIFEHNPLAQVALMDLDAVSNIYGGQSLCKNLTSNDQVLQDEAFLVIQEKHDNFLASVSSVVKNLKVDYINASWGLSRINLRDILMSDCGEVPTDEVLNQLLAIDKAFMRSISSLDYLDEATGEQRFPVVVQAAAQRQTQPLVVDDPDFPADCDSQPGNRIRVSAIYADPNDEAIPPEGSNDIRFITPTSEKEILACTDIYTPVGAYRIDELPFFAVRQKSLKFLLNGFIEIDSFPGFPSSSFAPPVIISALSHQQTQTEKYLSLEELLEVVANGHQIIDPLLYSQLNSYRLGYRRDEYTTANSYRNNLR